MKYIVEQITKSKSIKEVKQIKTSMEMAAQITSEGSGESNHTYLDIAKICDYRIKSLQESQEQRLHDVLKEFKAVIGSLSEDDSEAAGKLIEVFNHLVAGEGDKAAEAVSGLEEPVLDFLPQSLVEYVSSESLEEAAEYLTERQGKRDENIDLYKTPPAGDKGDLLTTAQAARLLGVTMGRIRQYIMDGRLKAIDPQKGQRDNLLRRRDVEALKDEVLEPGRPEKGKEIGTEKKVKREEPKTKKSKAED